MLLSSKQDINSLKDISSCQPLYNNLNLNIRNRSSLNISRKSILRFIRPSANSVFNSHNPEAIKFITGQAHYEPLAGTQIQAYFSRSTTPNF